MKIIQSICRNSIKCFLGLLLSVSFLTSCTMTTQPIVKTLSVDFKDKVLVSSGTKNSIEATLNDVAWMEGTWVGSRSTGHRVQHIIMNKQLDHMPGFVRSWTNEEFLFYEITTFAEHENGVSYRVKHFNYDLTGWEDRDVVIDRPLLGKSDGVLQFDGITFERVNTDAFIVYFRYPNGPKEGDILVIPFERETDI